MGFQLTPITSSRGQKQQVHRRSISEALDYIQSVKDTFRDEHEKYIKFLEILKDFMAQRIGTIDVVSRIKELFEGHPNLILDFNKFLPEGYKIIVRLGTHRPQRKQPNIFEAVEFINKIKIRFANSLVVYMRFLNILNGYRRENKSITEVNKEVSNLFCLHPDLIEDFNRFRP